MSDLPTLRASPFARYWPWPGNIVLFLMAAWLFYMGYAATVPDVRTAFFGLAGVSVLLLLFGLRTIGGGRSRSREAESLREVTVFEEPIPFEMAERGGRAREAYPLDSPAAMPVNSRNRERSRARTERRDQSEGTLREDAPERATAVYPPAPGAAAGTGEATLVPVTAPAPQPAAAPPVTPEAAQDPEAPETDPVAAVADAGVAAALTRERAERGASLAKLESDVRTLAEELRGEIFALRRSLEAQGEAADDTVLADNVLTKDDFNRAVNQRLLPSIETRITSRIADAFRPDALREAIGGAADSIAQGARTDTAQLRTELSAARDLAEKAIRMAADRSTRYAEGEGAAQGLEALGEMVRVERARIDELARAVDGGGAGRSARSEDVERLTVEVETIATRLNRALAETGESVEELRTTLGDVVSHVSRMGEHYQDLLRRIDGLGARLEAGSAASEIRGEVDALRAALTTIIEQNQEIRAQQDALSGRFLTTTTARVDHEADEA